MTAPSIQLQNFGLDADSFLHGFLGDVVTTVQKFTKPIQPFIDVFETPVPIISAFGSSETIGSLLLKGSGQTQEQQDRFALMLHIVNAVNSIDLSGSTGGAIIPFGTITLTGNAQQAGAFGFDTSLVSGAIDDILNIPALQDVEDELKTVGDYTGLTSTAGFEFPLLEDPGPVIGAILTGQTETMFSFSTGRQHFEHCAEHRRRHQGFVRGVSVGGHHLRRQSDDGLRHGRADRGCAESQHDPSKLLHGFYFDNSIDATAPPIPNHLAVRQTGLYLQGLMELSASAGVTIAGGLYANVTVELVNTDSSSHVHLDTMLTNLSGGGKVFNLSGKVYASADLELTLPDPIGPDITLFSFNLGYDEILNFDPPPPDFGMPVTIVDVADQHTLLLDVNKMGVGSRIVTVQPFHDLSVNIGGNTVEADGVRVDYPNEIYLFVERKNDLTTDYYNFVGLNGAAPDGVSINVIDPFRVFFDEGAVNPYPAQTKPGVLLAGGTNVVYRYSELFDGTQANALLVGRLWLEHAHRRHDDVRQLHSRRPHFRGQSPFWRHVRIRRRGARSDQFADRRRHRAGKPGRNHRRDDDREPRRTDVRRTRQQQLFWLGGRGLRNDRRRRGSTHSTSARRLVAFRQPIKSTAVPSGKANSSCACRRMKMSPSRTQPFPTSTTRRTKPWPSRPTRAFLPPRMVFRRSKSLPLAARPLRSATLRS